MTDNTNDKKYEPDMSDISYQREPKSKLDRLAKTSHGRGMQQYAEDIRDNVEETVGSGQFSDEVKDMQHQRTLEGVITDYVKLLEYKKGDQEIKIREDLTQKELAELKSALQNIKLPPSKKGEREKQLEIVNKLLEEIEARLAPQKEKIEIVRVKDNILNIISPLGNLYERTKKAVREQKWDEVEKCNTEAVKTVEKLHANMVALSEKAPDELIKIIGYIARSGLPVPVYKTTLINFAQTHKLPKLSEDVLMELKNQQKYGKSQFAEVFLNAYLNKPKNEDPLGFIRAISRVPAKYFNKIHQTALREMEEAA